MPETIGQRVRRLRQEQHLTADQLAQRLNVSRQHISQFERSEGGARPDTIQRFAAALGVSPYYLEHGREGSSDLPPLDAYLRLTHNLTDDDIAALSHLITRLDAGNRQRDELRQAAYDRTELSETMRREADEWTE